MDTSWDMGSSLRENAGTTSPSENNIRPGSTMTTAVGLGRMGSSMGGKTPSSTSIGTARNAFTEDTLMEYIPDLEEVQEEDLTMTVASAPAYKIQQITSLKELDADLLQSKPFSSVDGVSLRKLCKFVVPERFLIENDEFWDWENTYTEIASEFRKTFATSTSRSTKEVPVLEMPDSEEKK